MDKKRPSNSLPEDMKGFEEFVDGQQSGNFLPRPSVSNKKETSFENFTFLKTDAERLHRLKCLLNEKLPFAAKYEQGSALLKEQKEDVRNIQKQIFQESDKTDSAYRKSISDIFNAYFEAPKS